MNLKRPKIVQQIMGVLLFAVLIPLITIGVIISNISQQTVRHELNYSATMIAQFVGENISLYHQLSQNHAVSKDYLEKILGENFADSNETRQIYVLDAQRKIVATNAREDDNLTLILKNLPAKLTQNKPELFSKIKNQPIAYYKLDNPDWLVIVNTTEAITKNSINKARFRIILAVSLAALFIILAMSFYTFYLYTNVRQLFKGIIAISKGNYERKIRMIKNIFSPYEMYFIAKEFNFMAKKVSQSYSELSEKTLRLEKMDAFRSNLINAISHEFRTPLTGIIGYSSRLLRPDIEIDEETKTKSLKVIKEQAQMLSRMVEDLLVVPEIESFSLKLNERELNLAETLEKSMLYANSTGYEIKFEAAENLIVTADENRLIQIFINLIDNAVKYNMVGDSENITPVEIKAFREDNEIIVEISNAHQKIEDKTLDKLFEKFIRVDSDLTRTTRGTGLGLYIVQGLCAAMKIKVSLHSDEGKFKVRLVF